MSLANGGLARPMTKRVPVVFGSTAPAGRSLPPTVVLNAETVWRVAQIADRGPAWFRSFGTADEPGPRLASVSGAVHAPGVVETAAGVGVGDLISAAGGADRSVGGVGLGGLSGGWLSPAEADGAVWSRAGLAAYGLTPGPGTVHVLGEDECPLQHVSAVLDRAAGESAGQCGPCMFGVPAAAEDFGLLRPHDWIRAAGNGFGSGWGCCRGGAPAGSRTGWRGMRGVPFAPSPTRSTRTSPAAAP